MIPSRLPFVLFAVALICTDPRLIGANAHAQLTPPVVQEVRPLVVSRGESIPFEVRGQELAGASALLFEETRVVVEKIEPAKDLVKSRLRISSDLPAGPLRFRVVAPGGLSNPGRTWLGRPLAVVKEAEPNDGFVKPQVVGLPAAIDGEISPGDDVDVFAVELKAGETLVAESIASRAGSGLDPLVSIVGPDGRELASDDDRFGKDAAVWATVPRSGRCFVQIQDANGRLADNNVEQRIKRPYRLQVGSFPLVTSVFPGGGRRGETTRFQVSGINLPPDSDFLTKLEGPVVDVLLRIPTPLGEANPWTVRLGDAPETAEAEPNDEVDAAQTVSLPSAINGRFAALDAGDVDVYRLKAPPGREGEYAVSVYSARIGSPADPTLAVFDEQGALQAEDDDKLGRDARLERKIDEKGLLIGVREHFGRGGPRYSYRVEVEPVGRRPLVTVDLGARTLPRKASLALPLAVERRGFEGPFSVLTGPLPAGVSAAPVNLRTGAKTGLLVLSATADAAPGPFPIRVIVRDVPVGSEIAFREPRTPAPMEGPKDAAVEEESPTLAVAEPTALGATVEPSELTIPPGGQAELTLTLDRPGDLAKKPLKVRLLAGEGALDGLEGTNEATIPAEAKTFRLTIKAHPDAQARQVPATPRLVFEGGPEPLGTSLPPITLIVPERAK